MFIGVILCDFLVVVGRGFYVLVFLVEEMYFFRGGEGFFWDLKTR